MKTWKKYKYSNLISFMISLALADLLLRNDFFHSLLLQVESLGFFGALLGGVMLVSTFTLVPGALILLTLADSLSPIAIIFFAGLGACITDIVFFHHMQRYNNSELPSIYHLLGADHMTRLLHTPHFSWTFAALGSLFSHLPFAKRIEAHILGVSLMKLRIFMIASITMNVIAIALLLSVISFMRA